MILVGLFLVSAALNSTATVTQTSRVAVQRNSAGVSRLALRRKPLPISLNQANEAQLAALPGIGSVYAKKIVASTRELVSKKILTPALFEKIQGRVTI